MGIKMKVLLVLLLAAVGCATTSSDFYKNPHSATTTDLCRAYIASKEPKYRADLLVELTQRGVSKEECVDRVNEQNAQVACCVVGGLAGLATTALVSAAVVGGSSSSGGGGGYYQSHPTYYPYPPIGLDDFDCAGGFGNGPNYVQGPVQIVGGYDPYRLDADYDGIGCEDSDKRVETFVP